MTKQYNVIKNFVHIFVVNEYIDLIIANKLLSIVRIEYIIILMDVLFVELVNEIILRLDKRSLFYASQVSTEWRACCFRLISKITTIAEFSNACQLGDIFSISISKYEVDSYWLYCNFPSFCGTASLELVKLLISKGADNWRSALYHGCKNGQMEIVKLLIARGTEFPLIYDNEFCEDDNLDFEYGLHGACRGHSLELAYLMIAHNTNDWNTNLYYACLGGLPELVNLAITNGANNWDHGLLGACEGGELELAELMIARGAVHLDMAFMTACSCGQLELAELLLNKGVKCFRIAHRKQTPRQYLIDIQPPNHHLNIGLEWSCYYIDMKLWNKYKHNPDLMFTESMRKPLGGVIRGLRTIKLMIEQGATQCVCRKTIEEHMALCNKYLSAIQQL